MLTQYITRTQRLLQNPAPNNSIYAPELLTDYINTARRQLAGEARCIRRIGTISCTADQRAYSFEDIDVGVSSATGIQGVLHVRRINRVSGDGELYLTPRAWEWFDQYCLNDPVPLQGELGQRVPETWAQYGQGGQAPNGTTVQSGSFYLNPVPDSDYALRCDCVCYPIDLADDNDAEAIPFMFTDAVPFFAAYYALLGSQAQARRADAEAYYGYYQTFIERARLASNPDVLQWQYEGSADPAQNGKAGR